MKKTKIVFVVLITAMLAFPPSLLAQAAGRITYIEGRVDRHTGTGEKYLPVVIGEEVSVGDIIRTKSYAKAEITFADNSVLRLGNTSQIKIKEYEVDANGARKKGCIDLERGQIRAIVSKTKDRAAFDINTPNTSGSVKGSDIFLSYQKSATNILVADGIFTALNKDLPGTALEIPKGKTSIVPYNAAPQQPRIYLPAEKIRYENQTGPIIRRLEKDAREAQSTYASVVRIIGDVKIYPQGTKQWHRPAINEILNANDVIETADNGRIQISLDNGHVIELRANTYFIITSLSRDPKTGNYKNLFECKYGKIKAKLQKVNPESTFQVKTPTTVCGVLGTIMYLEIMPDVTKAFFEGGDGFITNLVSEIKTIIQQGMSASSDSQGNISDPVETTDVERSGFDSEWGSENTDDDTYGYTSPEGNPGEDYFESGFGDDTGNDVEDPTNPPVEPFNEVQQDPDEPDDNPEPIEEEPIPTPLPLVFSGVWGSESDEDEEINSLYSGFQLAGKENGTIDVPADSNTLSAGGEFRYHGNQAEPFVWLTPVYSYDPLTGSYRTSDGGAFLGFTAGSWNNNVMNGSLRSLYLDNSGNVGYISGNISGNYINDSERAGTWTADGELAAVEKSYRPDITTANFLDNIEEDLISGVGLVGDFESDNVMVGMLLGDAISFYEENWGIYRAIFLGAFISDEPLGELWNMPFAGTAVKTESDDDDPDAIGSSFMGEMNISDWSPNEHIKGSFNAVWLDSRYDGISYGKVTGDVIGNNEYEEDDGMFFGTFQAAGAGEWVEIGDLVDLTDLAQLTDRLTEAAAAVSLPITEMQKIIGIEGAGEFDNGGTLAATMDMALYGLSESAQQGIWALLIKDGTYTGEIDNEWSMDFSIEDSTIDGTIELKGLTWSNNEWAANVEGTIDNNIIEGGAKGTYANGQFKGYGSGIWVDEAVEGSL